MYGHERYLNLIHSADGQQGQRDFFAVLAALAAEGTAPLAANTSISHVLLVLPFVAMGVLLFVSGYYSGSVWREQVGGHLGTYAPTAAA
jgi:hypothetical protein